MCRDTSTTKPRARDWPFVPVPPPRAAIGTGANALDDAILATR